MNLKDKTTIVGYILLAILSACLVVVLAQILIGVTMRVDGRQCAEIQIKPLTRVECFTEYQS